MIWMDLQFQGFLVHMQHKEKCEAFPYIVVSLLSCFMKSTLFLHYNCSEYLIEKL